MIKEQLEKQIEEKKKEVEELLKEANEFYINNEFTMAKNRYRRGYHSAKDLEEIYEQTKDNYPMYLFNHKEELYENMFIIATIQYKYSICLINIAEKDHSNYEKEIWNRPYYFNYIERSIKALKEGLKYIYEISYSRNNIDYLSIKRDILYNLAFAYYKYNDMSNALVYITIAEKYIKDDNKKKEINELKENIKCYLEAQINKEL